MHKVFILNTILIIILAVTTITLFNHRDTWQSKKAIYKEMINLAGDIAANSEDKAELQKLKIRFDSFYDGDMIHAEGNDRDLLDRMMVLEKDFQDVLEDKSDFYKPEKLKDSTHKLVKQINKSISKGDSSFNLGMVGGLGLTAAIFFLMYSSIHKYRSKKKDTILDNPAVAAKTKIIKILFLASNPSNTTRLRIDKELREIDRGLSMSKERDGIQLIQKWAVTPSVLQQAILNESPTVTHFSGHGSGDGIILERENGMNLKISEEALGNLFSLFSDSVKCVFLNSCYSRSQAKAISKYIPYVIGMSEAVPDETAIAFSVGFYKALGAGKDFEFAYKLALNSIELHGLSGEDIPQLLKKEGV